MIWAEPEDTDVEELLLLFSLLLSGDSFGAISFEPTEEEIVVWAASADELSFTSIGL